jgi:hypothetical protein
VRVMPLKLNLLPIAGRDIVIRRVKPKTRADLDRRRCECSEETELGTDLPTRSEPCQFHGSRVGAYAGGELKSLLAPHTIGRVADLSADLGGKFGAPGPDRSTTRSSPLARARRLNSVMAQLPPPPRDRAGS